MLSTSVFWGDRDPVDLCDSWVPKGWDHEASPRLLTGFWDLNVKLQFGGVILFFVLFCLNIYILISWFKKKKDKNKEVLPMWYSPFRGAPHVEMLNPEGWSNWTAKWIPSRAQSLAGALCGSERNSKASLWQGGVQRVEAKYVYLPPFPRAHLFKLMRFAWGGEVISIFKPSFIAQESCFWWQCFDFDFA